MNDNLLRPDEAAALLAMSERTIKDELRRKNLRGIKTPAGWRIERADLETYKNAKANVSPVRRPA